MKKSPLFIGNNLATLVSAFELAKKGSTLTLLCDDKALGGHFLGLQISGNNFDIGMVMLEMRESMSGGDKSLNYNHRNHNDWTRFGNLASNWLKQHTDLIRTPTANCLVDGHRVPDYLISNRLDIFFGAAIAEPPKFTGSDSRHASNKNHAELYDLINYYDAAKFNHGKFIQEKFIEPFVKKLMGVPSSQFLARYHRAAWSPLYYPETLLHAIRCDMFELPEYPFWTTPMGFVGEIVKNLRSKLEDFSNVTLISAPVESLKRNGGLWKAVVANREYMSEQLVLGITQDRASSLLGHSKVGPIGAASVCLLFARVRGDVIRKPATCLFIVDSEFASYRLTDQDGLAGLQPEWHRITLEAGPDKISELYPGTSVKEAMERELHILLGINSGQGLPCSDSVEILKCFTASNALVIPSYDAIMKLNYAYDELLGAAPGAYLTGNLLGYGKASLNDQIVQGLIIAEELA